VTGTETTCVPDKTTLKAGQVWFKITNHGSRITELYLESPDAEELVEVEKIKNGPSGAFKTTVKPGSYLVTGGLRAWDGRQAGPHRHHRDRVAVTTNARHWLDQVRPITSCRLPEVPFGIARQGGPGPHPPHGRSLRRVRTRAAAAHR
jgi:hypothetical protein